VEIFMANSDIVVVESTVKNNPGRGFYWFCQKCHDQELQGVVVARLRHKEEQIKSGANADKWCLFIHIEDFFSQVLVRRWKGQASAVGE
jgi:hypothetical protein